MFRKIGIFTILMCTVSVLGAKDLNDNFRAKPAREGWFIGTGVGTQFYVGEYDKLQSTGYRFSTALEGMAGKWITPSLVGRIHGSFAHITGGKVKNKREASNMINIHADCMIDALNLFMGVNESRKITVLPFIGAGCATNIDYKTVSYSINLGATALFRINEHINLFTELKGAVMGDKLDKTTGGCPLDASAMLTAGFHYNF